VLACWIHAQMVIQSNPNCISIFSLLVTITDYHHCHHLFGKNTLLKYRFYWH